MSINQVRKMMDKVGCAVVVGVICTVAFVFSLMSLSPSNRSGDEETSANAGPSVATIGSTQLSYAEIEQMAQRFNTSSEPLPPVEQATFRAQVIEQALSGAAVRELARQKGIAWNQEQAITDSMAEWVDNVKSQLLSQGDIKPEATDADVETALKKKGSSLSALKAKLSAEMKSSLREPVALLQMQTRFFSRKLSERYLRDVQLSDDDVIRSFNTLELTRIKLDGASSDASKAAAVLSELTSGSDVKSVANKHGLTVESNVSMPMIGVLASKELAPLISLKAGQFSPVITNGDGPVIYKVNAIKKDGPSIDKDAVQSFRAIVGQRISNSMQESEIDRLTRSAKWHSKGHKALYDMWKFRQGSGGDPSQTKQSKLAALFDQAVSAKEDALGQQEAVLARYWSFDALWQDMTPEEKKKNTGTKIETIQDILSMVDTPSIRIQLAKLLAEQKNQAAGEELIAAANSNILFDEAGLQIDGQIQATLKEFEKQGVISKEQKDRLEKLRQQWAKDRAEQEKVKAQIEKERAEQEKQAAQEQKRYQEEMKKAEKVEPKRRPEDSSKAASSGAK